MKVLPMLILCVLVMAAGCRSSEPRAVSTASATVPQAAAQSPAASKGAQRIVSRNAVYTIEVIPNPRLTATSREGDETDKVYSSNIIAVHVQHTNNVTASSTNSTATPNPENGSESR